MSGKIVKRCKVCGISYETCYSCEKSHSWRAHTDTADHYYVFCVLMDYQSGKDASECYRALRKRGVDFAKTEVFLPEVRDLLDEIYTRSHNGKTLSVKQAEPDEVPETAAEQKKEAAPPQTEYVVGEL